MKLSGLLVLVVATLVSRCSGLGTGAPLSACGTMTPMHGVDAQTSVAPYNITVSSATYTPGGNLTVTVAGKNSEPFQGIFVQARLANCTGTSNVPQGTFFLNATEAELQLINCSAMAGSAVTHNSAVNKITKSFTWMAPATDVKFVYIRVTIAASRTMYWEAVNSEIIKGPSNNCTPTDMMTTTTPASVATTPSGAEPITTSLLLVAFCLVLSFFRRY